MRSVVHDRPGDADRVLRLTESPPPGPPGAGQVLVRPVHHGDLRGVRASTGPRIPGLEGMGAVEAVGADVTGLAPGARVAFFPVPGAWAEQVRAPAEFVTPVPDSVSDERASLMLANPLTVLMLLRAVREAGKGPVVQTAAGSSVGPMLTSVASRQGIPLVNVVRSVAGAAALAERFPSVPVITTEDPRWREQVLTATGDRPAVVLDPVAGSLTADLVGLLADGGTLVVYGGLGTGKTPLESLPVAVRQLTVRGVSVGRWTTRSPAERAEDFAFAAALATTDPDLFEVAATDDLADHRDAVDHTQRAGKSGTVLLTTRSTS